MVFADALSKAARLLELQLLFARSPHRTFRTKEIASKLGIAPRTVRAYVAELSAAGKLPVYHDGKGWRLASDARLEVGPLRLELSQATAVYLAARLLLRHSDEPNPAVREAVRRLALVVPEDLARSMEELVGRSPSESSSFAEVFRVFAYGWALRRVVACTYHPATRKEPFSCRFHPYLLEPAMFGYAVYAVGHSDPPGALRVYKLERVLEATLTEERFEPVPVGEVLDRLQKGWDVWLAEGDAKEVRLRIAPQAVRYIAEARWHPSQRIQQLADGSVELVFRLAPTYDLAHWIISWGDACRVLEPPELAAMVAEAHRRAAAQYATPTP